MKIYLATWLEDSQAKSLTKLDYKNRLLLFFFIEKKANQFDLRGYVREGIIKTKSKSLPRKPRILVDGKNQ